MAMQAVEPTEPDESAEEETPTGLDSLMASETAMAERKAGQSISTLADPNAPKVALMGALGWMLRRRTEPRLTYDAYMSSRTYLQIVEELNMGADDEDDEDDEEGKDDGSMT
jgi:hypothetical protein